MKNRTFFVTGIDTSCGKTMTTGLLAKNFKEQKKSVITMKIVQTGCKNISDDIKVHRKIMNEDFNIYDYNKVTCPYMFRFPASPNLASKLKNKTININKINNCIKELQKKFDYLIIEGIGGIMVPLKNNFTILDFLKNNKFNIIVVTSDKLGSINHTLLTLNALKTSKLSLTALIFNNYLSENEIINFNTKKYLKKFVSTNFKESDFIEIYNVNDKNYLKNLNKLKL